MPADRFVYFHAADMPSHAQLEELLARYVHGVGTVHRGPDARFHVHLPGVPTDPMPAPMRRPAEYFSDERCVEVYLGEDYVNVMTRAVDELTSGVADRLVSVLVRAWRGRPER